jgi:hypothetical protein
MLLPTSQTKNPPSFTPPVVEKLLPSNPTSHADRNPAPGAEIKIPAKRVVEMEVIETLIIHPESFRIKLKQLLKVL